MRFFNSKITCIKVLNLSREDNYQLSRLVDESIVDVTFVNRDYQGNIDLIITNDDLNDELLISLDNYSNVTLYSNSEFKLYISGRLPSKDINFINSNFSDSITLKRIFDFLLITLSLPVTLPLMLIVAIMIKLESKGSIIFTQDRVGLNGRIFKLYKFRTMFANSEIHGAKFAAKNDDRVTRIGKVIRKLRIDELPQFWNILKGDMSLIGPRPEQKAFVQQLAEDIEGYNLRHLVRPGISGWAQVTQGYTSSSDETREKLEYDLFYIKHYSFKFDLVITIKTIKTILTGFGAR